DKYVDEILKKFNYTNVKSASTPVDLEKPLVKDRDANDVDVHLYRSMIRSLMYLTASRPDIGFAVYASAKFQVTPKTSHLLAVKRIFKYLKGKPTLGLWYSRDSLFELVAYTNSDYARATQDRKSTTRDLLTKSQKEVETLRYLSLVVPLKKVGDEAVHKKLGDRMERPATTASSLEAEQQQRQALVDKKRVIIMETSIRSDLHLEDVSGTDCLPTATIFEEMAKMGYEKPSQNLTFYKAFFSPQWKFLIHTITQCLSTKTIAWNEFSSTIASAIICLATNQKFNFSKYIFDAMTPITTQPSSSRPQKKQSRRKQRKEPEVSQDEPQLDEGVPIPSNDPLLSGEDSMQLTKLMILCTNLQKQLERKRKSRSTRLKRLRKVGETRRVESSEDRDSLGAQQDASQQGRSLEDIDKDATDSLADETQGWTDDAEMFDIDDLHDDEVIMDMVVGEKQEQVEKVDERDVSTGVEDSASKIPTTTIDEMTLAQTLIEIKAAKPKAVTTAATTTTTTRPKARGVVVQEPSEFRTTTLVSSSSIKDKGKAKMEEPEVPLKKKDLIAFDKEMARTLEAQIQAELIEKERLARKKEEEANIALIESWDNTQVMMEVDFELAQRLQIEEQGEITIKERSRLFVELMNKRKKHFAMLRAKEKRRKAPTKAQIRNLMSTYLKNMGGYKYNQLKSKSYDEIQKLFDNEMKRVNTFIPMDSKTKKAESSEQKAKGSRKKSLGKKRVGKEQKQESSKRQRIKDDKETDEHEEAEEDDEAEMKMHMEGFYHLIRADGSTNRYSPMIRMLQSISRKDLETLWKLVKTKYGSTRPEDEYERVFWGDLQAKYALEIHKKHGMDKCDSIGTPMATKPKLDVDLSGTSIDQTKYHSMIGSLMYLTSSRPDIVQAVCYCVRYQARSTEKHLKQVKRIFRYLKGTINMGIWYLKDYGFKLTAFSDAYRVGCIDTRKSTSRGIPFLGDKLVSWMSKKQECTVMSSAEAKYMV
ncbi:hypothetical protein Tco_0826470, partial [Tanacetum coccineum]